MSILLLQTDSVLSALLGIYVPSGPRLRWTYERECEGARFRDAAANMRKLRHILGPRVTYRLVFRRILNEFAPYLSLSPRAGCSSVEGFTFEVSCWLSELDCLVKRRIQRNREGRGEGGGGGDAGRASASSALKAKYPRPGASTHEA